VYDCLSPARSSTLLFASELDPDISRPRTAVSLSSETPLPKNAKATKTHIYNRPVKYTLQEKSLRVNLLVKRGYFTEYLVDSAGANNKSGDETVGDSNTHGLASALDVLQAMRLDRHRCIVHAERDSL